MAKLGSTTLGEGSATPRSATDQLGNEPLRHGETALFMAKAQQPSAQLGIGTAILSSAQQRQGVPRTGVCNGDAALGKATVMLRSDWHRHGGDVRGQLSYAQKRPAKATQSMTLPRHSTSFLGNGKASLCLSVCCSATAKPSLEPQWHSNARTGSGMAPNRPAKARRGLAQPRHAAE